MDIHRLFIILSISLVFITLFCDDYLIEGAVGDNDSLTLDSTVDQTTSGDGQRSEVDVTLSGERSNDVRSRSEMNSSTSGNEDLTIDIKKDEVSKDGGKQIFGTDCVKTVQITIIVVKQKRNIKEIIGVKRDLTQHMVI